MRSTALQGAVDVENMFWPQVRGCRLSTTSTSLCCLEGHPVKHFVTVDIIPDFSPVTLLFRIVYLLQSLQCIDINSVTY
jgi:hypothetical protein